MLIILSCPLVAYGADFHPHSVEVSPRFQEHERCLFFGVTGLIKHGFVDNRAPKIDGLFLGLDLGKFLIRQSAVFLRGGAHSAWPKIKPRELRPRITHSGYCLWR